MEKKEITLFPLQDRAIFTPKRFKAIVAGLQGAKTISGAIWSRIQFDNNRNQAGLIAAPTYKILSQSTIPKFFEINPDLKSFYKKGDSVIELPDAQPIYIRSTENPNVIEGMTLGWTWADEAGQMKLDAWINFQGRLSILKGNFLATTTPYTLNWLYTDFYEQAKKNNPEYGVFQWRSCDNPYFPKEEYERVKQTMDSRTFRRRYDGLFEKMEGLVFEDFAGPVEPFIVAYKEVIAGIDWGFNNPSAIAVIGITPDNEFHVIDEYYKSGVTTAEVIERCKYFKEKYKVRFWYPDPAEPDRLEEMKRAGIYPREVIKNKGDRERGIDIIREYIRSNRFKIFSNCIYTLDEISMYHYAEIKGEGEEEETPVKENDHLMDAINYSVRTYMPVVNKPKIVNTYTPKNTITGY